VGGIPSCQQRLVVVEAQAREHVGMCLCLFRILLSLTKFLPSAFLQKLPSFSSAGGGDYSDNGGGDGSDSKPLRLFLYAHNEAWCGSWMAFLLKERLCFL
jgi:hypothetical protein